MKKYLPAFFIIVICKASTAQPTGAPPASFAVKELKAAQIPARIKYKGNLFACRQWADATGENYLIASIGNAIHTVKAKDDLSEDQYSQYLFASHLVKTDTGYKLLWKLEDGVTNCWGDITSSFFRNGIFVTDEDKDGIAETTVAYRTSCRTDVSPSDMKIIMHEGSKKYALRGLMVFPASEEEQKKAALIKEFNLEKVKLPPVDSDSYYWEQQGRYINEKDFAGAPALLAFARAVWRRFMDERKAINE
jgi:hypothetical protein